MRSTRSLVAARSGRRRCAALAGLAAGVVLAGSLVAACGSSSATGRSSSTTTVVRAKTDEAPLPAGKTPSKIATMVCAAKAAREIAEVLGVTAVVQDRAWVDHRYSCDYVYPNGHFTLSVKELSSWAQTFSYFRQMGVEHGNTGKLGNLGQGAFTTSNGSVVVRKDWKVLFVDISGLPAQFGKPPTSRADVAYTIADIILGCWAGD